MNVYLPQSLINKLLIESETFRQHIIEHHLQLKDRQDAAVAYFQHQIRTRFPDYKKMDKIAAIKWIREQTRNNEQLIKDFVAAGFESYPYYIDGSVCVMSLAGAKKFVESI